MVEDKMEDYFHQKDLYLPLKGVQRTWKMKSGSCWTGKP